MELARIYNQTDRPRDALEVLDLCIRTGEPSPVLLHDAGVTAYGLQQFDVALSYLDPLANEFSEFPGIHLLRALCHIEMRHPAEAREATNEYERQEPATRLAIAAIRACASALEHDAAGHAADLERVLGTPLVDQDKPGTATIMRLLHLVHETTTEFVAPNHSGLRELEHRLLVAGHLPSSAFRRERHDEPKERVNVYACRLWQPLDASWRENPHCPFEQRDWQGYHAHWLVLAPTEEQAERLALSWQSRCAPDAARCVEIVLREEGYEDVAGVVVQGPRIFEPDGSKTDGR